MPKKVTKIVNPSEDKEFVGSQDGLFSDDLDIVKHALKIHSESSAVPADYVLFKSDENDYEFIRKMHRCALAIKNYIKDEKVGNRAYSMLISETVVIAALKRNHEVNPILAGLFARFKEVQEDSFFDTLKNKLSGKKNEET